MSWHLGRLAGFDTESTGVDIETDRIVTACIAEVGGKLPSLPPANWLINPGVNIPTAASAIHKVTTEKAKAKGQDAAEAITQIVAGLAQIVLAGTPLVIMNASYDLTLLDREARRHGVQPLTDIVGDELRVVDPKVLDKQIDPRRPGRRTLTDLCRHYGVKLDGAHTADADAIAACRVAWRIGAEHADIGRMPLAELHDLQVSWAKRHAEGLASYFRRTAGKEHLADGVRTEWPLVPAQRDGGAS